MKISDRISKAFLFNGLPTEQIEELARICLDQKFEKGRQLFSEGDEAQGFYLLTTGKIKIYKLSLDGKEQILHIFGSGEILGEVPVFAGGTYPANAAAIEQSRTLFFPRRSFLELMGREPAMALNMLAILSLRLRGFTHLIEGLSLREVPGRLAAYLIFLSERDPGIQMIELEITKAQLSSLIGTIPETLSRILTQMSQQGIISVEGRKIQIINRKALVALAAGNKDAV